MSTEQLSAWLSSFRLKTLPLALSAILVGASLAYWQYKFNWLITLLALLTATSLQILSNLANDYGDAQKGADKSQRLGPLRGIHSGIISMKQMQIALVINIALVIILGLLLLFVACQTWQELFGFMVLGAVSIIAAITYTVGNKPYGYIGFGDLSVLVFFGLVSIIGSYYLQVKSLELFLFYPAIGCGLFSVAVLNINNLRDLETDKAVKKRTFIVLIGDRKGRYYHVILLMIALILLSLFSFLYLQSIWSWLFLITFPFFCFHIKKVLTYHDSSCVPPLLFEMVKLALSTNLLYCIGIILS